MNIQNAIERSGINASVRLHVAKIQANARGGLVDSQVACEILLNCVSDVFRGIMSIVEESKK